MHVSCCYVLCVLVLVHVYVYVAVVGINASEDLRVFIIF